jgi:hypothetical protein
MAASVAPVMATASTGGWIFFDNSRMPFSLTNPTMETVQSPIGSDGKCTGTFSLDHAPGASPVAAVELAVDPTSCQQKVEVGTPSVDQVPPPNLAVTTSRTSATNATGMATPSVSQRQGDAYSYWHDPAFIVVNYVDDVISWTYNGSTIQGIIADYDLTGYLYVPFDHWSMTYHPAPTLKVDINDRYATLTSNARFYNTDFCGGTGTTYQPTTFTALPSGGDRGTTNTWDYGCDANLLSWVLSVH